MYILHAPNIVCANRPGALINQTIRYPPLPGSQWLVRAIGKTTSWKSQCYPKIDIGSLCDSYILIPLVQRLIAPKGRILKPNKNTGLKGKRCWKENSSFPVF